MTSCPLTEKHIYLLPSICPLERLFFEDLCFWFSVSPAKERGEASFRFLLPFPPDQVFVHTLSLGVISEPTLVF